MLHGAEIFSQHWPQQNHPNVGKYIPYMEPIGNDPHLGFMADVLNGNFHPNSLPGCRCRSGKPSDGWIMSTISEKSSP